MLAMMSEQEEEIMSALDIENTTSTIQRLN